MSYFPSPSPRKVREAIESLALTLIVAIVLLLLLGLISPAHAQTISGANQVQGTTPTNQNAQGNPVWIGGWDGTKVQGLKVDGSGNLDSVAVSADSTASGTISAPGSSNAVCIPLMGNYGAAVTLSGTWTATIQAALKAADGSTIINSFFYDPATESSSGTIAANSSRSIALTGGASSACVYASAFTSGPVSVSLRATTAQTLLDTITNLPATVAVNSGAADANTIRVVTATNSPVQLSAGSSLVGKVGIDQTTPGTTNAVAVTNLPTTVSTNLGSPDASTIRVVTATATPADATPNANVPGVGGLQAYGFIFNGSTWDRIKGITGQTGLLGVGVVNSGTNAGDALSNGSVWTDLNNLGNSQIGLKGGMVFNNSTWDRTRSGAVANLPNLIGSTLTANVAVDPCQSSAVAKSSVAINISSATTTSIVAISGSTTIYTCGWSFTVNGTTPTYQFEYGTGATCGTGTVVTTGVYAPTVGSFATYSPGMTAFPTIAAQRLCIVSGGTGPSIQGVVTYVQQ